MTLLNRSGAGARIRTGLLSLAAGAMLAASLAGCASAGRGGGGPVRNDELGSEVNPTGMPLLNEPYSLTFFTGSALSNRYEDTLVWSKYADMTNITVRFELVPFDALAAKRNLALSDESYPDVFYSARLSPKELDTYGRQGVLIPLDDLIEQYAPHFSKLMEQYPDIRKGLTMSDGHIYSLPSFYDPNMLSMLIGVPLWVNKSWLDKLEMPEPTSIEQFYNYLKAVKSTDLNGNGIHDEIPYSDNGITDLINQLKGAWGLGTRGWGIRSWTSPRLGRAALHENPAGLQGAASVHS
ncbi:extracellular solute-binding protein [Cohnella faecalis]|uniref:extracellular solute-binding protein n=1 Tax=Cohnella faecalis TaxID=2315694 RepID=UPI001F207210|nr:extracellular solute-binding protein [Cohnella faecalis]